MKTYQTLAFILSLSVVACLSSCMKKDGPVPVVDLTNVTQSVSLNLSDLVSDMKIIRLETSESSLIGTDRHFIVGEKYIICYSRQNILQFDSEGKFIRSIAKSGKGPYEFTGRPVVEAVTNSFLLFSKMFIEKDNYSYNLTDPKYYFMRELTGEPSEIKDLYVDYIGKNYSENEIERFFNYTEFNTFKNQFIASMEAVTLKVTALSADDLDLPEEVYQRLKSLDAELDENDNPVLFVGSIL